MSLRNMEVQYVGDTLYLPSLERDVNHIVVRDEDVNDWEHFEKKNKCKNCAALNRAAGLWAKADKRARDLERTCRNVDEDGDFECSECGFCWVFHPHYCPNCGCKMVNE